MCTWLLTTSIQWKPCISYIIHEVLYVSIHVMYTVVYNVWRCDNIPLQMHAHCQCVGHNGTMTQIHTKVITLQPRDHTLSCETVAATHKLTYYTGVEYCGNTAVHYIGLLGSQSRVNLGLCVFLNFVTQTVLFWYGKYLINSTYNTHSESHILCVATFHVLWYVNWLQESILVLCQRPSWVNSRCWELFSAIRKDKCKFHSTLGTTSIWSVED